MIELGDTVRDRVTGLEGVVLAKLVCLYEEPTYRIHSSSLKPDDGGVREPVWMPEGRLDVVALKPRLAGFHRHG